MKLNELGGWLLERWNVKQQEKHCIQGYILTYPTLLEGTFDSSGFSVEETTITASMMLHYRVSFSKLNYTK